MFVFNSFLFFCFILNFEYHCGCLYALFVFMQIIKKIKNKFSTDFHSRREYILAKLLVVILTVPNIVLAIRDIILWILGKELEWYVSGRFVGLFIGIFLWIILNWVVEWLFLSSWKITANMKELPKNIWSKNTIIQYDLSEVITPPEAGILLYGRSEISNLLCLIYKWINEKKIVLYVENGKKYLKKIQWLDLLYSDFERFLFECLFNFGEWPILFDKKLLKTYLSQFNDMVVKSCMRKWYIDNKINISGIKRFLMSENSESGDRVIVERNVSIWCLLFLFIFPWFAIASNLGWLWPLVWIVLFLTILANYASNKKYYIHLTDKWKDVLSQIYWYKYYLEHCEEEQINSDLDEGEVYSKHLPYAIALKLNWKIIKELS